VRRSRVSTSVSTSLIAEQEVLVAIDDGDDDEEEEDDDNIGVGLDVTDEDEDDEDDDDDDDDPPSRRIFASVCAVWVPLEVSISSAGVALERTVAVAFASNARLAAELFAELEDVRDNKTSVPWAPTEDKVAGSERISRSWVSNMSHIESKYWRIVCPLWLSSLTRRDDDPMEDEDTALPTSP